jgi:hypothetical protein
VTLARRGVLAVSAAIPLAAALSTAPLTTEELRILAMCATPSDSWRGREDEYNRTRVVDSGSKASRIWRSLEQKGLVKETPTPWRDDMESVVTATPAGLAELRKIGVEVEGA